MVTYINIKIEGSFSEFSKDLSPKLYTNLGKTWEDYLDGKWVKLNTKQISFRKKNPNASVKEVFDMKLDESIKYFSIIDLQNNKIEEILNYDSSPEINVFFINGKPAWLDKIQRNALLNRFEAEKRKGKTETSLWFKDMKVVLNIENAISIIYAVENYAAECYDNTNTHIFAIKELSLQQEIETYDYKIGYPNKLNFDIC